MLTLVATLALACGSAEPNTQATWVYFTTKGIETPAAYQAAIDELERTYAPRAIERRRLRRTDPGLFDERDVPVSASYIDAVLATGARHRTTSRWLNAVSVEATPEQVETIRAIPGVRAVEPVRGGRREELLPTPIEARESPVAGRSFDYGIGAAQVNQINLAALHDAGYTGAGVIIGILDTGFRRTHEGFTNPAKPLTIVAMHDFINDDGEPGPEAGDPDGQSDHGTYILGTLASYRPGELVGTAFDASYILCKTEDISSETPIEEDYYAAGLEYIEANGGDVATASLGYIDWYSQSDLDGQTAVTTIAVNVATANGVHCCNAAGNAGHDSNPSTSHLIAPTDAFRVISVGAVDESGTIADFSSDGPTADGRLKPEMLARGVSTATISAHADHSYTSASGTSLSTPLVAGAVACLTQARPGWTVDQMREFLACTGTDFVANGQADPLSIRGYGIVDAFAAYAKDCNANGVADADDIASGASNDCNQNSTPDECEVVCAADLAEPFGTLNVFDFLAFQSEFSEGGACADLALPVGVFNVFDFLAFQSSFGNGC